MLKSVVHDLYIIILKEKSPFILLQCRICIAELSRDKTTFLSDFPKEIVFQSRPLAFLRQRCRQLNKCQKKSADKIHCKRLWKRGVICTVVRCVS